jgi:hypothetical protein
MDLSMFDLVGSVTERVTAYGQQLRLERTGEEFTAVLTPQPSIDPRLDLGADPREMALLEGRRDMVPELKYGDTVTQISAVWAHVGDVVSFPWKVVKRDDNPANVAIRYWLVKIGEFDEQ